MATRKPRGRKLVWRMEQKANGYGYEYRKEVFLNPKEAILIIHHEFKNTGDKSITTEVYNHNFFNVNADPVGPNYSFAFPFEVKAKDLKGKFGEVMETKDK